MGMEHTNVWPEFGKYFAQCSDSTHAHKGYFFSLWDAEHFECLRQECAGHRIHKAQGYSKKLG